MNASPPRLTVGRHAITLALIVGGYVTIGTALPTGGAQTFHGHEALARGYVAYATVVGLCLSLVPRVSALRGVVVAFAAMGVAGVAAHTVVLLVIYPDGYVPDIYVLERRQDGYQSDGTRLWSAFGSFALANVISGAAALRIGLRCSFSDAILGAFGALLALPAVAPLAVVVLLAFELVRAAVLVLWSG